VRDGVGRLILLCRDAADGRAVAQELVSSKTNVEVDVVPCDLSSMRATAAACEVVRGFLEGKTLDLLVLCAAAVFRERGTTAEGLEQTFAVNYLSNFLIAHSLFELVEQNPGARIVVAGCASFSPLSATLDLDDLQAERGHVGPLGLWQYAHTKVMLECFVSELARRLRDKGSSTTANVFHPGAIKSKLSDEALEAFSPFVAKLANVAMSFSPGTLVRTPEQGAALGEFLANDINVAGVSGKVFDSGFTGKVVECVRCLLTGRLAGWLAGRLAGWPADGEAGS
jgi:NAD(P)-dependent dehydrogenase (short-subunit alcohol dehydrogenase family)